MRFPPFLCLFVCLLSIMLIRVSSADEPTRKRLVPHQGSATTDVAKEKALTATATPTAQEVPKPTEKVAVNWITDVNEAWKITQEQKQPLLLFVVSDNCFHCVRMKKGTYNDKGVVSTIQQSFIATSVHADKWSNLVERLGVSVFPSTIIISPENKVMDRMYGYISAADMQQRLAQVTKRLADAANEVANPQR